ncbi:MAG: hypothetical protein GY810_17105 [Aureispira sp.]|nr:hypothetical protein [Aureispira sp.]
MNTKLSFLLITLALFFMSCGETQTNNNEPVTNEPPTEKVDTTATTNTNSTTDNTSSTDEGLPNLDLKPFYSKPADELLGDEAYTERLKLLLGESLYLDIIGNMGGGLDVTIDVHDENVGPCVYVKGEVNHEGKFYESIVITDEHAQRVWAATTNEEGAAVVQFPKLEEAGDKVPNAYKDWIAERS